MRDERSSNAEFRAALRELATLLVYEATRDLAITSTQIATPVAPTTGTSNGGLAMVVPTVGPMGVVMGTSLTAQPRVAS